MARRAPHRKLRVPASDVEAFAAQNVGRHRDLIHDGYQLRASSGVWRRKDGCLTVYLVYRRQGEDGFVSTVACTIRQRSPAPVSGGGGMTSPEPSTSSGQIDIEEAIAAAREIAG